MEVEVIALDTTARVKYVQLYYKYIQVLYKKKEGNNIYFIFVMCNITRQRHSGNQYKKILFLH